MDILLRISAVLMMVGLFLYALLQMLIAFIVMYWFAIAAVAVAVLAYKIHGRRGAAAEAAVPGRPWEPHPSAALPSRPVHPVGAAVAPIYRPVAPALATTRRIEARAVPPRPRR
jgi:hypothetical protein